MTTLEKNIAILQDKIYSSNFDISKSFLPNEEVIKNIIKSQYPQYDDDVLNMMVGLTSSLSGLTSSIASSLSGLTSSIASSASGLTSSIASSASGLTSSISKENQDLKDFTKKNNIWPLPKDSSYHKESEKKKSEIKEAVMLMVKEQEEILDELVKVSIQTSSSIAGASLLISPPSFNVPGAISLILLVVTSIGVLISKILSTIENLAPLKYLPLVLPEDKYDSIVAPINISVLILISLYDSTRVLQKLIDKLMSALKKKIKTSNSVVTQEKSCALLVVDLDNLKKAKVGAARLVGRSRPTKSQLEKQAKLIEEKKAEIKECRDKVDILKNSENLSLDPLSLNEILNTIDPLNEMREISEVNTQFLSYVYDVHLPDGSVITNLSDVELESIRSKYNLIFDNRSS
jgi:hypothetical protein